MIAKEQNLALLIIGNAALNNPIWIQYAEYCFAREKGLRKEAFKHLESFIRSTCSWSSYQKIEFVNFLFPYFEKVEDADYGAFPQPLSEKLVKPTLEEWCKNENVDERPFRWYGTYFRSEDHLFKAIELNPKDNIARQQLLSWWTYNIYYSLHHLPEYYIGDPYKDLQIVEKIKTQIEQLTDLERQDKWRKELEDDLELITNYIEWKKTEHPDLEQWGKENNKKVSYTSTATYYYNK